MECRVCETLIDSFTLSLEAPGLSSLTTPIDAPTQVAICRACGHAQGPEPVELTSFYDVEYRISLQSDDFDQLYQMIDGKTVYRTERQVGILLDLADVPQGARVLDYGAAKAQSLQRLIKARPDIVPHVFDVSRDYQEHWDNLMPREQTATYALPPAWECWFDLITTYFVLEHIVDPTVHLRRLHDMLAPDGKLFVMVPNALTNTGDLLVVDHVNHFTVSSLIQACALAGLKVEKVDETGFTGAVAVLVSRTDAPAGPDTAQVALTVSRLQEACALWSRMQVHLDQAMTERPSGILALHGAGFYGSLVMQRVNADPRVRYVLDANPHLQGGEFLGRPVMSPAELPSDVDGVIVALNPAIARRIVGDGSLYGRPGIDAVFLDGM